MFKCFVFFQLDIHLSDIEMSLSIIIPLVMSPSNGNAKRSHAQNLRHGKEVADCRLRNMLYIAHSLIYNALAIVHGSLYYQRTKIHKKKQKNPWKLIHVSIKSDPSPTIFWVRCRAPTPYHPGGPNLRWRNGNFSVLPRSPSTTPGHQAMIHSDGVFRKIQVSLFGKWYHKLFGEMERKSRCEWM